VSEFLPSLVPPPSQPQPQPVNPATRPVDPTAAPGKAPREDNQHGWGKSTK
jgi:hypothetical protein